MKAPTCRLRPQAIGQSYRLAPRIGFSDSLHPYSIQQRACRLSLDQIVPRTIAVQSLHSIKLPDAFGGPHDLQKPIAVSPRVPGSPGYDEFVTSFNKQLTLHSR